MPETAEAKKARDRQYYADNREKCLQSNKLYRIKNHNKIQRQRRLRKGLA